MTRSSLVSRQPYTGTDAVSTYTFPFYIGLETDLLVTEELISDGTQTTYALTTDYTVLASGVKNVNGGSITLVAGNLPSTKKIVIRRKVPLTQITDIRNQSAYFPEDQEDEYDKRNDIAQQQQDEIDRSFKFAETVDPSTFSAEVTGLRTAGSVPTINSAEDGLEWVDVDAVALAAAVAAAEAAQVAAETAETNAETAETNAATSETNAGVSETNAAASEAAAAASAASIDAGMAVANNVKWDCASDTVVTIRTDTKFRGTLTGSIFTFASDKTFTITGTAGTIGALDQGSEASSTWYYLIALGDTTAVTATDIIAVSAANYASWTVANLTGNYSVFDDFKRIGAVYNDSSSNLLRGFFSEDKFWFDEGQFTLSLSTSSATFADADCSAGVPPVSNELFATFYLQSTAAESQIKRKGAGSTTGVHIFEATSGLTNNSCEVLLNDSQVFEWKTSAGSFGISSIVNYTDNLQKEK